MYPEQSGAPNPSPNYDFILNPEQPAKPKAPIVGGVGKNPFVMRLVLIIGGAVVLMIVAAIAVNLLFGSRTNVDDLVALAQTEQEIVRLSGEGSKANDQAVKNAASTTRMSVKSHQQAWLSFLGQHGRSVPPQELALKKSASADQQLTAAKQNSTFDTALTTLLRAELEEYGAALKDAYAHATGQQERALLQQQYEHVQLLLQQWPQAS